MKQQFAISSRVYGFLLKFYPKGFREDYAQEMLWVFEDMAHATLKEQGDWGILWLWLRVLPDWCFTVVKEQLENIGYQGAKQMSFNNQLTSTLALFSRALRAGYNVKQCFEIIIEHAPEPTKSRFKAMLEAVESGKTWIEATELAKDDTNSNYGQRLLEIFKKQLEEGGNLADKLDEFNREIYPELGDEGWAKKVDLEDGYNVEEHYPIGQ
jgi:hypothetical protein